MAESNPIPDEEHTSAYDPSWSHLGRKEIVNKIKGLIYGQAIGDAYGLATEFFNKKTCVDAYGEEGPKSYNDIVQDAHRMRWKKGDWTDDTDQLILIMQMVTDLKGKVDKKDFAKRLLNWKQHGFEDLGDIGGMGIGFTVTSVLRHEKYLEDPHLASQDLWEKSKRYLAPNGAVMRTAILGAVGYHDIDKVMENTRSICRVTHYDPRCVASCAVVTTAIAMMLKGQDTDSKEAVDKLVNEAIKYGERELKDKKQKNELRKYILSPSLADMKLDDKDSIGYTIKCVGAGFYGIRSGKDFMTALRDVIMEGGDADTNGSVCGALIGCMIGYEALPKDMLTFPYKEWLDKQVDDFLRIFGYIE